MTPEDAEALAAIPAAWVALLDDDLNRAEARHPRPAPTSSRAVTVPAPRMALSERIAGLTVPPPPMPEAAT